MLKHQRIIAPSFSFPRAMKSNQIATVAFLLFIESTSATGRCAALYQDCSPLTTCQIGADCANFQSPASMQCIPSNSDHIALFEKCGGSEMNSCGDGASCVSINKETSQCLWDSECSYGECEPARAPLTPVERVQHIYSLKVDKARKSTLVDIPCHENNGDEEAYPGFIGQFHKTLPHDEFGEVDPEAYNAFLRCLETGDMSICDKIPGAGKLANPLGGIAFNTQNDDYTAFPVPPPPSIASAEMAALYEELAWMAVLRDVPFTEFGTHPDAAKAAESLAKMEGYRGMGRPFSTEADGRVTIDPATQLFRMDLKDALIGPAVSQFLLKSFFFDGIEVRPLTKVGAFGSDYMTDFNEWLMTQNGENTEKGFEPHPNGPHYLCTPRDLGAFAYQDVLFSPFFRALSVADVVKLKLFGGPYVEQKRNMGFTTWGKAQVIKQTLEMGCDLGPVWYSKWNVNRFLRPEAFGGLVHLRKLGIKEHYPIHSSLLQSEALDALYKLNGATNKRRSETEPSIAVTPTYLLPQIVREGSLTHPSYPAGHAIVAGAAGTILKVWLAFNEEIESACFPDPVVPLADGSNTVPYVVEEGGKCPTILGEINKLVQNVSQGREMSGFHYRVDSWAGILQGEANAIAYLKEQIDLNPECDGQYSFTAFDGSKIIIKPSNNCHEMHHKNSQ